MVVAGHKDEVVKPLSVGASAVQTVSRGEYQVLRWGVHDSSRTFCGAFSGNIEEQLPSGCPWWCAGWAGPGEASGGEDSE
jgi:hypothetical protein